MENIELKVRNKRILSIVGKGRPLEIPLDVSFSHADRLLEPDFPGSYILELKYQNPPEDLIAAEAGDIHTYLEEHQLDELVAVFPCPDPEDPTITLHRADTYSGRFSVEICA